MPRNDVMTASAIRSTSDTRTLVRALADPSVLGHPVDDVEIIETHISCVLLAGAYAYKLLKPVRMPFADFRDPASRHRACASELALNRRWAPDLYLALVPVRGTPRSPTLGGEGAVIEHALKMRRFADGSRLDQRAALSGLDDDVCDALAACVAALHGQSPPAAPDAGFGTVETIRDDVEGNLEALGRAGLAAADAARLGRLVDWSHDTVTRLGPAFEARLEGGRVRECHGDLHLANIAWIDDRPVPFDGVAFRDDFRIVDVASDLAFLLMDLHRLDMARAAWRVRDGWLQATGDHDALTVLRHYLVYRALVRAKVAALREAQQREESSAPAHVGASAVTGYLTLAERLARGPQTPAVIITHGLSGSGKSVVAARLAAEMDAAMLRSDVERRRMHPRPEGRYDAEATRRTYAHLFDRGRLAIESGYPVILDATFLDRHRRAEAARLADALGVPFRILDIETPLAILEARVQARLREGADPSEADVEVLAAQRRSAEPLTGDEMQMRVAVDGRVEHDGASLLRSLGL